LKQDRGPEALQLLQEANAIKEKEFQDFKVAFASGPPQEVHRLASKLAGDPRFQALMKQKTDLPKRAKLTAFSDSGIL